MSKGERQNSRRIAFDVGSHGGCEASLFEFRSHVCSVEDALDIADLHIIRIAARTLDEALEYLRWHEPEFAIEKVENMGLILMVSGSPVD